MRAVRAWSAASERAMQAAVGPPAHTVLMRPLVAFQQPQHAARCSVSSLRGLTIGLAAAAPQAALMPTKRSARMLSASAAAPDVAADTKNRLFEENYDPDYHNFVAITGTLSSPATSPSGDFSFVLKVQRSQLNKQPGEPDAYDSFVVEAPSEEWRGTPLSEVLQPDMLLQVSGKLRAAKGDSGAPYLCKVLATDIGIMKTTSPEDLVAAGPNVVDLEDESLLSQSPTTPATPAASQPFAAASSGLPPFAPPVSSDERETLWIQLFQNPAAWYDNRTTKKGRQPDFKEKSGGNGAALWIDDRRTPRWVLENLQRLPGNLPYTGESRPPAGGSSSWSGAGPRAGQLDFLPAEPGSEKEAAWIDVFSNYRSWWDNRMNKLNPKAPDFKHKTEGTALWVNGRDTPQWVLQNIEAGMPKAPPPRQKDN